MATAAEARDSYLEDFKRLEGSLPGSSRPGLAALRRRAIDSFAAGGFPTAKNEDWKYTSAGPFVRTRYRHALEAYVDRDGSNALREELAALPGVSAKDSLAVFLDGRFVADLSRVKADGLTVESFAAHVERTNGASGLEIGEMLDPAQHGFVALNTAFATDGVVVRVSRGKAVERPLHVVFYASKHEAPLAMHPRNLIAVETGASVTIVEHWLGEAGADYLNNAATEIQLEDNAALDHVKIQRESEAAHHVHRMQVRQQRDSRLRSFSVAFGAAVSRTEIATALVGEGAECTLYGVYLGSGRRHVDHHTTVDHVAAHTTSRELYKGILDHTSRGVFTGKVIVRPNAQKISAEQSNKNLLLADGAIVETRPQLEIYADDVKCSHGAAIGRLDEDALFYLRQRGIDLAQARGLLTYAFGSEVLDKLPNAELRRDLEKTLLRRVRGHGEGEGDLHDLEEVVS